MNEDRSMTDVKVVRTVNKKYEAWIEYSNGKNTQFEILEDTNLVDGIGGTAWVSVHAVCPCTASLIICCTHRMELLC